MHWHLTDTTCNTSNKGGNIPASPGLFQLVQDLMPPSHPEEGAQGSGRLETMPAEQKLKALDKISEEHNTCFQILSPLYVEELCSR